MKTLGAIALVGGGILIGIPLLSRLTHDPITFVVLAALVFWGTFAGAAQLLERDA